MNDPAPRRSVEIDGDPFKVVNQLVGLARPRIGVFNELVDVILMYLDATDEAIGEAMPGDRL